nr:calcium-translocating P-type ATPase, SERCA-type [Candidatus Woesearchaeota archaeon]
MEFYKLDKKEVLSNLNSDINGLTNEEARKRLEKYGLNEIKEKEGISPLKIYLNQYKGFVVYILIAAVVISLAINEILDAIVILSILILNSILGFIQEYKAERAIKALKKLSALKALVIRNGKKAYVDAKYLVLGDIVVLNVGDKVPADLRLLYAKEFKTQEASLTGESNPVKKSEEKIIKDSEVADRYNMAYSGTDIVSGKAIGIVVKTGEETELGNIAHLIKEAKEEKTLLQKKLGVLGKWLGIAVIFISLIVFLVGVLREGKAAEMLVTAISLAVAAIPEGLPAVVTISLAFGVKKMIKKNVLVRNLPSVETIGSTDVICVDKTGTLTKNQMTVKKIYANDKVIDVSGSGYITKGDFFCENKKIDPKELELLLTIGTLCNDTQVNQEIVGDPTEAALIVSCEKAGLKKDDLEKEYVRIDEIPFTSERKFMATYHSYRNRKFVFVKGAPEIVLNKSSKIYKNGLMVNLRDKDREKILGMNEKFANSALRVLAFAFKQDNNFDDKNLVFVGLQAMIDPPRDNVKEDIEKCINAGIKVVMITGDHPITAREIAREIGINGKVLTGDQLEKINLIDVVEEIGIYARVNPEHKLRIIDALQNKGHVVAMTGDGVNDAPAIKKADIGIAMGISGTEVAREASDMILTDDNFGSIVNAVEEGRGIYDNIKKFVNYLLSSNFGEVLVLFAAMLIGFKYQNEFVLPLVALQILWMNLVTDGLPALALGVDPASKDVMLRKPRNKNENIITKNMAINIVLIGIIMTLAVLFLFDFRLQESVIKAQTIAFTTLVMLEMMRVYLIRKQYKIGLFENKFLLLAVISSILLQLAVIYTPLSRYFRTTGLDIMDWAYILGVVLASFVISYLLGILVKNFTKETD